MSSANVHVTTVPYHPFVHSRYPSLYDASRKEPGVHVKDLQLSVPAITNWSLTTNLAFESYYSIEYGENVIIRFVILVLGGYPSLAKWWLLSTQIKFYAAAAGQELYWITSAR
ncbi:hypothetical protein BU17DRAFT_71922 [Hysterangium stoloniferum]|nr:hypothetical protein BU17DRAFT_71922 [Hysterangium stoloniferum]